VLPTPESRLVWSVSFQVASGLMAAGALLWAADRERGRARVFWALLAAGPALTQTQPAPERVPLIMTKLPPSNSPTYKRIIKHAGKARGQVLTLTKTEMWEVPKENVEAVKKAAAEHGAAATQLGSDYNEVFRSAPVDMRIYIKNEPDMHEPVQATGSVFGFTLTDVLPGTDTAATPGKFKASMDFRELYRLFTALGPTVSVDGVCQGVYKEFTPVGCEEDPECWVKCQPCPDDGAPYCLTLEAEDIAAVEAPNLSVVEVTEASRPATCVDPLPSP